MSRTSACKRGLHAFTAIIAFGLLTQPASASFIIVTNNSSISASGTVERRDPDTFAILGTDSDNASQNFPGATSLPGTTSGAVTASASAAGSSIDVYADIEYSLTENAGIVGVLGSAYGSYSSSAFPFLSLFQYDYSSTFDLDFQTSSSYQYSLTFDVNGHGGSGATMELTDLSTNTQVDFLSLNQNNFGFIDGALDPGSYRLRIRQWDQSVGNEQYVAGSHYSNAVNGSFTPLATPVPAAIWLFGGALGALGLTRRRISAN